MLLEIICLVIAVAVIGTFARGKGISPILAGSIAVAGWLIIRFGAWPFVPPGNTRLLFAAIAWVWLAAVAGYVRFAVGATRPKPESSWECPNCNYLNEASSTVCQACRKPWQARQDAPAA